MFQSMKKAYVSEAPGPFRTRGGFVWAKGKGIVDDVAH